MNQDRKAKLQKRAEQQQRSLQRKHELMDNALQHAGLLELFRKIPPSLKKFLRGCIQPAPEIVLDASAADCEEARGLQCGFPEFVRRPSSLPLNYSGQLLTPNRKTTFPGRLPSWFQKTPKRRSHKTLDLIKTIGQ